MGADAGADGASTPARRDWAPCAPDVNGVGGRANRCAASLERAVDAADAAADATAGAVADAAAETATASAAAWSRPRASGLAWARDADALDSGATPSGAGFDGARGCVGAATRRRRAMTVGCNRRTTTSSSRPRRSAAAGWEGRASCAPLAVLGSRACPAAVLFFLSCSVFILDGFLSASRARCVHEAAQDLWVHVAVGERLETKLEPSNPFGLEGVGRLRSESSHERQRARSASTGAPGACPSPTCARREKALAVHARAPSQPNFATQPRPPLAELRPGAGARPLAGRADLRRIP